MKLDTRIRYEHNTISRKVSTFFLFEVLLRELRYDDDIMRPMLESPSLGASANAVHRKPPRHSCNNSVLILCTAMCHTTDRHELTDVASTSC